MSDVSCGRDEKITNDHTEPAQSKNSTAKQTAVKQTAQSNKEHSQTNAKIIKCCQM